MATYPLMSIFYFNLAELCKVVLDPKSGRLYNIQFFVLPISSILCSVMSKCYCESVM